LISKDQFGREIKIGDFITYPVRSGSSVHMSSSIVEEIKYWEGGRAFRNAEGKWETVKVLRPKLKIVGLRRNWDNEAIGGIYKSNVVCVSRTTIVERECLIGVDEKSIIKYDEVSGTRIVIFS